MSFRAAALALLLPALVVLSPVAASGATAAGTVTTTAAAPGGVAGTTSVIALPFAGVTRSYRLFVPTKLPLGPRPLLVGLHGFTTDAAYLESTSKLDASAAKSGTLVAYPDGLDNSWNAGTCCGPASASGVDDVGFLAAVIADVAQRRSVDRLRVAMAGYSNGGMMAYRFACERSDLVDVVDVAAGAFVAPACAVSRPVSLLHVHGLLDQRVPYKGGTVTALNTTFPAVKGPVAAFASFAGCTGSTTTPFSGSTVATVWQGTACSPGSYVQLITSSTMGHVWSTGSADAAKYGVDMTGATWGFTSAVWSSRGTPVALS